MSDKKSSWEYQKNRNYKQVKINFDLDNDYDAAIHHYLECKTKNKSRLIKSLLYAELERCSYEE